MTLDIAEITGILEPPLDTRPDPDAFVQAAMAWHFHPDTGSPFWLKRAGTLDFDPRRDVRTLDDLTLFPNVAAELRHVPAADLIPRGYGNCPDVVGVFESGGTTGAPKRVVLLRDWLERMLAWSNAALDAHGFPRGADWLGLVPSGPHIVGEYFRRSATTHGRYGFSVDLDPRWVKRTIAEGRGGEASAYAEHVIDQAEEVLRTQDVSVLTITPPLLERLTRRNDLVDLVNDKVRAIRWGGTQLDADSRHLYRTEVFPDTVFSGNYGSTMILGFAGERPGLPGDGPCVFDTLGPYVTFQVVDPQTRKPVAYGERGRVVAHHVSKSFLLPNNLERDLATRVEPPEGGFGDSVADIAPVDTFEEETVIEGVY
ncbi:phenazine antibiotic biosynthesis protein [Streptomyces sp. ALI-76-A]|jgi:phenylacetate-coenzyme A ligase PaaK-like adenylate-forming protein|uniref:phenazine antibiotic biosynthesis protein n=1 Tax=Streptomyces sp. ALI-76-A TaxID=3025736 RepID=UPI00256F4CED|nr:phenazine antibiotic biosynthesis protein [Streptomyces sp. ALI-76-A]MDL5206229.1 phenazine antibiotic biosynthesis protein [Streptomyces sp. ALI-76-A]